MSEVKTISAQERAQKFAIGTRQNKHGLATKGITSGGQTVTFDFPKNRILAGVKVMVEAVINIKHATETSLDGDALTPFKMFQKISLDLNNGFSPFSVDGKALGIYNMMKQNSGIVQGLYTGDYNNLPTAGFTVSSAGANNTLNFTLDLPVSINKRDAIGMILLQSNETNVQLSMSVGMGGDMFDNPSGYTINITSVKLTPVVETFSVPADSSAMPDLTVLKLVQSRNDSYLGAGQHIVKLSTGMIYRKIAFLLTDENGVPLELSDITSNIDLVFNQADTNYSIPAKFIRLENEETYNGALPKGVFCFDFASEQGMVNLSGTRDLIDTQNLTEFWIRFNVSKSVKVHLVTETLARLV